MKIYHYMAFIGLLFVLWGISAMAQGSLMQVQVKSGQLRNQPSYLGKVLGNLPYGAPVTVLAEKGDWMQVKAVRTRKTGWTHRIALTEKRIEMRAGQDVSAVSGREVVIAGKGFNETVEREYKLSHRAIDYTWINRMEKGFGVSQQAMDQFLKLGGLTGGQP